MFSSQIDFRAHQASQHSKNRAQARQLGTIPMEFQSASVRDRKQQREPAHRGNFTSNKYISKNSPYLLIFYFEGTFKSGEFNTQGNNNSSKNER